MGALEAVRLDDVAVTAKASCPVALPFAGGVMAAGAVQVIPAGKVVGQTTVTAELKPFCEVTVIVELTLAPVIELKVTGVELTVNAGVVVTLNALLVAGVSVPDVAIKV
jgi:hypothetical protein